MPITDNILIAPRNLARNPVVASMYAGANATCRYRISSDNAILYEGSITTIADYAVVDLSDFFEYLKIAGLIQCRICLVDNANIENSEKFFTVYGGGISKLLRRKLSAAAVDFFDWKLKNVNNNFFLTTRTNGRLIVIPEDELLPLKFYAKGLNFSVKVTGETVATYDHSADAAESLQEIDFNTLRRSVMTTKNKLASAFDIITSTGGYACTIVIAEVTERHDYFLKFINSLGAQEMISITGLIQFNPTFSELKSVALYDAVVNDLVDCPRRKTITNTYKAEIGYKTPEERLFVIDALLSDNCMLVANGEEYAVNVKTDGSLFQDTASQPTTISVNIEMLDKDYSFSPIDRHDVVLGIDNNIIEVDNFKILV